MEVLEKTRTSLLLLAVLDDSRCVHEGDPLQELVGHLDANQLLQKVLAKLL